MANTNHTDARLAHIQKLLNAIPDLIFIFNRAGVYLDCLSGRDEDLLLPRTELVGKSVDDVLPAQVARQYHGAIEQVWQTGQRVKVEYALPFGPSLRYREAHLARCGNEEILAIVRDITERKALAEEQARLSAILDATADLVATMTADGYVTYLNPAAQRVFGYNPQSAGGHTHFLGCFPLRAARKLIEEGLPAALRLGSWRGETTILSASGDEIPVSQVIMAHRDVHGRLTHFSTIASDIRERLQAELALRESERRFRLIADDAPVLIWVFDEHEKNVFVNRTALEFKGTTLAEHVGDGWEQFVHPDDWSAQIETVRRARPTLKPFQQEFRMRRHDGAYRWLYESAIPRFDDNGVFRGYMGTQIDITERRQAEEALREREAMLRTLGDNLPNGFLYRLIIRPDEHRQFTYVSAGVEQTTGVSAAKAMRDFQTLLDQLSDKDRQRMFALSRAASAQMGLFDFEYQRRLPSGEIRWAHARSAPRQRLPDGTIIWDGLELDITDRKLAEEALLLRNRALEAVSQGVLITSCAGPDDPIIFANEGFCQMTGYSLAEILGHNLRILAGPQTSPEALAQLHAALQTHHSCLVEMITYRKDGQPFWGGMPSFV